MFLSFEGDHAVLPNKFHGGPRIWPESDQSRLMSAQL